MNSAKAIQYFLLFSLLQTVFAIPQYLTPFPRDVSRIDQCARLMAHYNKYIHDEVFKNNGCEIKKQLTKGLKKILTGVNLTENQVEISFKHPIQSVNFQVPDIWKEEKRHNFKRGLSTLLESHDDIETLPYMFTTQDGLFLISPISKFDFQANEEGFGSYFKHMENNPDSLLVRIIGMFSVDYSYYVVYVSPFNALLGRHHVVMEFSHEHSTRKIQKHYGKFPFGLAEWTEFTKHSALQISPEDEQKFGINYHKDMVYLSNNNYINYQLMIAVPNEIEITEADKQPYNSYYSVYCQEGNEPFSVSITNFFKRSKNEEKVKIYSDSLEIFRKSKVLYGASETGKSLIRPKKP